MKIEGNGIKSLGAGTVPDDKGVSSRAGARKDSGGTSSSTVQLSTLSARMRDVETRLSETPVVNAAKVDEIKQAMADGKFRIKPDVVADKLIDTVRELITANKA